MTKVYAKAAAAHRIATNLDIPFGAAWRVANCINKRTYPDEAAAEEVAATWRKNGTTLRPYECDVCGLWHLTSHRAEGGKNEEEQEEDR